MLGLDDLQRVDDALFRMKSRLAGFRALGCTRQATRQEELALLADLRQCGDALANIANDLEALREERTPGLAAGPKTPEKKGWQR